MEVGALKHDVRNDTEHRNGNALLNHFKLNDVEGTSVAVEAESVCRYLTAILKEGNTPRKSDDTDEWPVAGNARLLETEMPIPSKRHEDVAQYKQDDGIETVHFFFFMDCDRVVIYGTILLGVWHP